MKSQSARTIFHSTYDTFVTASTKCIAYVVFCFAFLTVSQSIVAQRQVLPINSDMRLLKPVTVKQSQLYLGELLEILSRLTSVNVKVKPEEPISGVTISTKLDNVPLHTVMLNISSLLSLRGYALRWSYDIEVASPQYQLTISARYREMSKALEEEITKAFVVQLKLMVQIAYTPPKDRMKYVKQVTEALSEPNETYAKNLLSESQITEDYWNRLRLFDRTVPANQLEALIQGQPYTVPFSKLNQDDQEWLMSKEKDTKVTLTQDGVTKEILNPPITSVSFLMKPNHGRNKEISKRLMFSIKSDYYNTGTSICSVKIDGMNAKIFQRWLSYDGVKSNPDKEQLRVSIKKPQEPQVMSARRNTLPDEFERLKFSPDLSYLAVLPEMDATSISPITNGTLLDYLKSYQKSPTYTMSKWQDDMLLVSYPVWFYGDDALYPYSVVKALKQATITKNGELSLDAFLKTVAPLSIHQAERLEKEFPGVSDIANWKPARLISQFPDLLTKNGIPLTPQLYDFFKQEFSANSHIFEFFSEKDTDKPFIRVSTYDLMLNKEKHKIVELQLNLAGRWLPVSNTAIKLSLLAKKENER